MQPEQRIVSLSLECNLWVFDADTDLLLLMLACHHANDVGFVMGRVHVWDESN